MKHLSWFLGHKGENSDFLLDSLSVIFQDYIHWRKNYYPNDTILIDKKIRHENKAEYDKIHSALAEMLAQLGKSFPFFSPRYIGHMLSDVSIPATLGYIAGMLHNPNNCTPETAPVTVQWEIEACNKILEMLGFTPAPSPPPKEASSDEMKQYNDKLKEEFGWAHITSGGTIANIEALWTARIVKYYPLSIQDIAIAEDLNIEIKLPKHTEDRPAVQDIKQISKKDLLFIKPNESIYLFSRFINALREKRSLSVADANVLASELLKKSRYSLSNNMGKIFTEFPPVIFVSGAAHYSIRKAADLLGIGSANVILVNTASNFRLDVKDLESKINIAVSEGKIPIAVIAVAGTTEEGAVDPVHEIVELRKHYEKDNKSFWLHIDCAWGGYIASLFNPGEEECFSATAEERAEAVCSFVKDTIDFSLNENKMEKEICWGDRSVINSFLSLKHSNSITVDPHKLGYLPYPCGVVAFRNDRVRHFVMQRAPYITLSAHNALLHNPPQHIEDGEDYKVTIDAFAPFILEGSKPGAAASALWFASKIIPLDRKNHGLIIRESIISARELYEWIAAWEKIYKHGNKTGQLRYDFKTFPSAPDTNVFVFAVKSKTNNTISGMNTLTGEVYKKFSIKAGKDSGEHDYSQSFFLSSTRMDDEHYKFEVFEDLFRSWGIDMKSAESDYKKNGLVVLRAAVMNPYIASIRRNSNQNIIRDFVCDLHKCADEYAVKVK